MRDEAVYSINSEFLPIISRMLRMLIPTEMAPIDLRHFEEDLPFELLITLPFKIVICFQHQQHGGVFRRVLT